MHTPTVNLVDIKKRLRITITPSVTQFPTSTFRCRIVFFMSVTSLVFRGTRLLIRKSAFDKEIKIPETGGNAHYQKEGGEDVACPQLLIEVHTEHEAAENRDNHGKAEARRVSHLKEHFLFVGIMHRRIAYSILVM